MSFPELLPIQGTSKTEHGLKYDILELLNGMSNYKPLVVQSLHHRGPKQQRPGSLQNIHKGDQRPWFMHREVCQHSKYPLPSCKEKHIEQTADYVKAPSPGMVPRRHHQFPCSQNEPIVHPLLDELPPDSNDICDSSEVDSDPNNYLSDAGSDDSTKKLYSAPNATTKKAHAEKDATFTSLSTTVDAITVAAAA